MTGSMDDDKKDENKDGLTPGSSSCSAKYPHPPVQLAVT